MVRQSFSRAYLAGSLVLNIIFVLECCCLCMSAHAADVRLITDRADKDLAVEVAIKTFEEVWLSRVFSVCPQQQHFVMGKKVGV